METPQLIRRIEALVRKETEATVELLQYLGELDSRRAYEGLGYSSLFDFCTRHLKYSEPGASRRISCARVMRDYDGVREKLFSREVSLSTLSLVASFCPPGQKPATTIHFSLRRDVESSPAYLDRHG